MSFPNKTQLESLHRALYACVCKPGTFPDYETPIVHAGVIYCTNRYVAHRVEGLMQPGCIYKSLHAHDLRAVRELPRIARMFIVADSDLRAPLEGKMDPDLLRLALRPYNALDLDMRMRMSEGAHSPLVLDGVRTTHRESIRITTIIQPKR